MTANAFERGARAKRRGRSVESNPFAKRAGRGNAKKANDWLLGWHSVEYVPGSASGPSGAFAWPPLVGMPAPPEGDYGVRMRGLRALFRPVDDFEWELLVAEMRAGVVEWVPEWARIGYLILWHYCDGELGVEPPEWVEWVGHPMKYLASVIRVQGSCSRWPTLVVSAYEELDHESPERND